MKIFFLTDHFERYEQCGLKKNRTQLNFMIFDCVNVFF